MESLERAEARLMELARGIDFAPRYYALVAASKDATPCNDMSPEDIVAVLAETGRSFKYNRKERFYSTRETGVPGDLGLNLSISGVVEFILVVRGPAGHIGDCFHVMALNLARQYAPELAPNPPYPRPRFRDVSELRKVLAGGLRLYMDLATAIRASGILG